MDDFVENKTFPNGDNYTGFINKSEKYNGKGILRTKENETKIGDFHNGLFKNGYSIVPLPVITGITQTPGNYYYGFNIVNGKPKAEPTIRLTEEDLTKIVYDQYKLHGIIFFQDDRKIYIGDVVNGIPQGKGALVYKDGKKYTGEFVNGIPEGKGILTESSGKEIVKGTFKNGKSIFEDSLQMLKSFDTDFDINFKIQEKNFPYIKKTLLQILKKTDPNKTINWENYDDIMTAKKRTIVQELIKFHPDKYQNEGDKIYATKITVVLNIIKEYLDHILTEFPKSSTSGLNSKSSQTKISENGPSASDITIPFVTNTAHNNAIETPATYATQNNAIETPATNTTQIDAIKPHVISPFVNATNTSSVHELPKQSHSTVHTDDSEKSNFTRNVLATSAVGLGAAGLYYAYKRFKQSSQKKKSKKPSRSRSKKKGSRRKKYHDKYI
jgi:hypothetical protein